MLGVFPQLVVVTVAVLPTLMALPADPDSFRGAGVWLGWLGAGLLAASLLLMVREPRFAEWFGGLERMYRWHHGLGTVGYVALLIHPIALADPFFAVEPGAPWNALSPFRLTLPTTLGWIALILLMGGLAATFAVKLRYSLWLPLHSALCLGVSLGTIHVLTIAGLSPSAWIVIIASVLALGWRLLGIERGGSAHRYEVRTIRHPIADFTEASLRPLEKPLRIDPGQFVMVAFFEGPTFRGCGEYHPYTVSDASAGGTLTLSIKALGDCTRHIQSLVPGTAARVQGPYGTFFSSRSDAPEIWIAGGIGITPFLAMLHAGPVTQITHLFYVCRDLSAAPYLDELAGYAAGAPLFNLEPLAVDTDAGPLIEKLALIPDLGSRHIYLCAPPAMMKTVIHWLQERGVGTANIHFEAFDFR